MQVAVESFVKNKHLLRTQTKKDQDLRLLADVVYKTLRDEGCQANDIIALASQLIGRVTTELPDQLDSSK